jgi:hypothetical protein
MKFHQFWYFSFQYFNYLFIFYSFKLSFAHGPPSVSLFISPPKQQNNEEDEQNEVKIDLDDEKKISLAFDVYKHDKKLLFQAETELLQYRATYLPQSSEMTK